MCEKWDDAAAFLLLSNVNDLMLVVLAKSAATSFEGFMIFSLQKFLTSFYFCNLRENLVCASTINSADVMTVLVLC